MPDRLARGGTLILGGGFAGSWVARLLGKRGVETTIVSPENFMLFTPLLPEAASGTLEPRHVVVPLRMMCPRSDLLLGSITGLDEAQRAVTLETEDGSVEVTYERLVVALGAVARTLPIPGLAEYGHGFKDLADAIALRNHVLRQVELADGGLDARAARRHLTFVFVGAGYAGVEALAELWTSSATRSATTRVSAGSRRAGILVDAAPSILPEIPTKLGEYAARELAGRGVEVRVGTTLEALDAEGAELSGGERVATNTLVWTAGVRANPMLHELGLPLDDRGQIQVDDRLRVEGRDDIWALGDCARVPNAATPGTCDPPTSQHALRQARTLAPISPESRVRTATACWVRSRRWGGTEGSQTSSDCAYAVSRGGSSPGRTT